MKVKDLIKHLQTFDPDLEMCYRLHSEQVVLNEDDFTEVYLCEPRPDGWVQNARPDKPVQRYLRIG